MLRMPAFRMEYPETIEDAVALLKEHPGTSMLLAGGTDLVPNMKHKLFEPEVVVSLGNVAGLRGICEQEDHFVLGAMTTLSEVAASKKLIDAVPGLPSAAGQVSGPQLRNAGTIGGNVMLDTRCQWYNQTYFWRKALGYCLKKDGTKCHVVEKGSRCVAAASNDTAPMLMALDAELRFVSPRGETRIPISDLWKPDGIWNKSVGRDELLVEIRIPKPPTHHSSAYLKMRDRGSIDFPLLGFGARLDFDSARVLQRADLVSVALQAKPTAVRKVQDTLQGLQPDTPEWEAGIEAVSKLAKSQCRPMDNIPGDADYRHRMVPVIVRRVLRAATQNLR